MCVHHTQYFYIQHGRTSGFQLKDRMYRKEEQEDEGRNKQKKTFDEKMFSDFMSLSFPFYCFKNVLQNFQCMAQ